MIAGNVFSVQFINGTDYDRRKTNSILMQKKNYPIETPCFRRFTDPARLFDRTIYSLWKTRMQVRRRSRSRPQILSIRQLSRTQAGTSLCTPEVRGSSKSISGQLQKNKKYIRGDLQHQSRAFTTERNIVKNPDEYQSRYLYAQRYWYFGNLSGQYAPGFYCRSFQRKRFAGGDR